MRFKDFREFESYTSSLYPEKRKGDFFEDFCEFYFRYRSVFFQAKEVYNQASIPEDIRQLLQLETKDYGVDGVIVRFDGSLVAYQAKFRTGRQSPTVRELATFLAEAQHADEKLIISNSSSLPPQLAKHGVSVLGEELDALDEEFFEAYAAFLAERKIRPPAKKKPYGYQASMITGVMEGFARHDRGKLIAACGTGKTLVGLWLAERMQSETVLFFAPSLALIKQTLDSWSESAARPFSFLAVCSDETVVSAEYDYRDYAPNEVGFSVTTDPEQITKFLNSQPIGDGPRVVFSTYQSAAALIDGFRSSSLESFDLALFDEAHKTAGIANTMENKAILDPTVLKARKRLYMTATERLVAPWLVNKAAEADRVVFSMDDEEVFGPTLFSYNFGSAIDDHVIADYQILVSAISSDEVARQVSDRQLLIQADGQQHKILQADLVFRQMILKNAFLTRPILKALSFHNTVARARSFALGAANECEPLSEVFDHETDGLYVDFVDGTMTANERKRRLAVFANSRKGVISNAKCLTEGVDVPLIDSVYFADPKTSIVDIVQACGRALRKPAGVAKKTAYIVIPVLLDPEGNLNEGDFKTVLKVVQALRSQDERLAQYVDNLNLKHAKGGLGQPLDKFIDFEWPEDFDEELFAEAIQLRLLEGLGGPLTATDAKDLERRRADSRKILKPVGDYASQTMESALVRPTLERLRDLGGSGERSKLSFQNNNVAQTERLGLIELLGGKYVFTERGTRFFEGEASFTSIFKEACLDFEIKEELSVLFPYRIILGILLELGRLDFPQFVFGPYSIRNGSDQEVFRATNNAREVRELYPHLDRLSPANRRAVLADLNERFETTYGLNEVWGSTTVKNRFGYFKSHLALFEGVIALPRAIEVDPHSVANLRTLLT